jgi:hypothetical protein
MIFVMLRTIQKATWSHEPEIHNLNSLNAGLIRQSYVIYLSVTFLRAPNYVKCENESFNYTVFPIHFHIYTLTRKWQPHSGAAGMYSETDI